MSHHRHQTYLSPLAGIGRQKRLKPVGFGIRVRISEGRPSFRANRGTGILIALRMLCPCGLSIRIALRPPSLGTCWNSRQYGFRCRCRKAYGCESHSPYHLHCPIAESVRQHSLKVLIERSNRSGTAISREDERAVIWRSAKPHRPDRARLFPPFLLGVSPSGYGKCLIHIHRVFDSLYPYHISSLGK